MKYPQVLQRSPNRNRSSEPEQATKDHVTPLSPESFAQETYHNKRSYREGVGGEGGRALFANAWTSFRVFVGAIIFVASWSGLAFAQAKDATTTAEKTAAAARMNEMRSMIENVEIVVQDNKELVPAKRSKEALLRTIEVGREDGSLWLYSHKGLPVAFVELWARDTSSHWGHTLLAIKQKGLTGRVDKDKWVPTRGDVNFRPVPKTKPPKDRATFRLIEMRRIARRFKTNIEDPGQNNFAGFRLLTEPIHRYKGGDVADGTVFAFTRGETNPEVLLFVQARKGKWEYGLIRCSSNELVAKLDGKEVWRAAPIEGWVGKSADPFWVVYRDYSVSDSSETELPESKEYQYE